MILIWPVNYIRFNFETEDAALSEQLIALLNTGDLGFEESTDGLKHLFPTILLKRRLDSCFIEQ